MLGLAVLMAATTVVPPQVDAFLHEHRDLTLVEDRGASCPVAPEHPADQDSAVAERDLTGDGRPDLAFVVMSTAEPHQFGVVALHSTAEGPPKLQWVVKLGPTPLGSLRIFHSPYGDWILVNGCRRRDGASFLWKGAQYMAEPVL
jgi:hypothetical protein